MAPSPPPRTECRTLPPPPSPRRLNPRLSFASLVKSHPGKKQSKPNTQVGTTPATDATTIKLDASASPSQDSDPDLYHWAVVFENQRGLTLFSVPYYSSSGLLPSDPAPFTMPSAVSLKRAHQPDVSLKEYPLPDGNWRWVSNSWMVDMRSDDGQVQHDGFEYNWIFRQHHWRPHVGPLSAGGWVRRRRWIRLMMRPGKTRRRATEEQDSMNGAPAPTATYPTARNSWNGWDKSLSTSVPSLHANERDTMPEVLQGNIEAEWFMCRNLLRAASSDGAKLELWKRWLGLSETEGIPSTDIDTNSVIPPMEYVIAVLRAKLTNIIWNFFIFPESRRSFVELLFKANVFDRVSGLDHHTTLVKALAFWSLNGELNLVPQSESMDIHTP
ncbi:hypothetical protein D9757_002933 [Collybiopsis confluens]|uniref:TECPR1-like DysF domain-containing protein n=1 Tax=Collybiopsis confluens TaxID=2823264 RepID=A0A8H5HVP1_9AGAR|nr:hypothetical protein D9757_002933 [Collybiopsis confluens]